LNQQKHLAFGYIICGYGCLLGSAFVDNLRGPLIPIIARDLAISYELASWLLSMGSIAGLVASLGLIYLMSRLSERRVAIGLCLLGILGSVLALSVASFPILLVFAAILGASIISLNIIANVLTIRGTPPRLQARVMGGLHAMYGTGSFMAPIAASRLIESGWSWGHIFILPVPLLLILIGIAKFGTQEEGPAPQDTKAGFGLQTNHILLIIAFGLAVAAEVLSSSWMVTYLTEAWKYDHVAASDNLSLFFALLMGTRIVCLLIDSSKYERQLLWSSLLIPLGVFGASFLFNMPQLLPLLGFFGPFFPLMMTRTVRVFPEMWRALSAWVQVGIQIMLATSHYLVGYTATHLGVATAYLSPLWCLIGACGVVYLFEQRTGLASKQ
jgi:fucose permease